MAWQFWRTKLSCAVVATEDKVFDQSKLEPMGKRAGAQITKVCGVCRQMSWRNFARRLGGRWSRWGDHHLDCQHGWRCHMARYCGVLAGVFSIRDTQQAIRDQGKAPH